VLGDVSVIVFGAAGSLEITDQRVDDGNVEASRALKKLLDGGTPFMEARGEINKLLIDYRKNSMNREGGYWIASTNSEAPKNAIVGAVDDVNEILLATDGFMRCLRPFALWPSLDEVFRAGLTLREVADEVRKAERMDDGALEFPRWSINDDICAARLRWIDQ